MIDRDNDLPLTRQAAVLNISRGSLYYKPRPVSATDLALMRRMDELHLEFPFAGARMLQGLLAAEGSKVGRRHVRTLMRRMGMETVYRRPNTSKPAPGHRIYPYLLRGLAIDRPNQVWAMGASLNRYIHFYSGHRPHSSVDGRTPDQAYFDSLPFRAAAYPRQRLHLSTWKFCSDNRSHLIINFLSRQGFEVTEKDLERLARTYLKIAACCRSDINVE